VSDKARRQNTCATRVHGKLSRITLTAVNLQTTQRCTNNSTKPKGLGNTRNVQKGWYHTHNITQCN